MERIRKKVAGLCLACVFVTAIIQGNVQAAEQFCKVTIPVEIDMEQNNGQKIEFAVALKTNSRDVPMPDQREIIISGNGKAEFGPIFYTEPGDYQYQIYQKAGSREDIKYSDTIYRVNVQVLNDEEGGLICQMIARTNDSQGKKDRILFENQWIRRIPDIQQEKTGCAVKTGDTLYLIPLFTATVIAAIFMILCLKNLKINRGK